MSRIIGAVVMIYFGSQWVGLGMAIIITLIVLAMQQQDDIQWAQRARDLDHEGGGR